MALASPRTAFKERTLVPEDWEPQEREHRRMLAQAANEATRGKLRNTGSITLTANSATTTIINPLAEAESCLFMTPTTASAAAENWYVSAISPGQSITVTHANTAAVDRTFCYAIFS